MFHPLGPTFGELVRQCLSSTKEGYDLLAPKFDWTPFLTPHQVVEETSHYLKSLGPFDHAADLCTGTGAGIRGLLPITRKQVIGIDWSFPMLVEAERKFKCESRVQLICKDIFTVNYLETFDLITCFGALGHIDKPRHQEFVSLVRGMLKPGGLFAFITMKKPGLLSPIFWYLFIFDMAMRVRNLLIKPKFIMYYLNFILPEVPSLFPRNQWVPVTIIPLKPFGVPGSLHLVIAKKTS